MNLAIFASGNGSNFSAIVKAIKQGKIKAGLVVLVCDKPEARVISRAQKARVAVILVKCEDFASRLNFETAIIQRLKTYKIDLIILAGWKLIVPQSLINKFKNKIINKF